MGAAVAWAAGGDLKHIAAAAAGGAVTGGLAAATCGMSLGAQIAGSAMAGTAGYCAEKLVAGEQGTATGMAYAAISGAEGAMLGAVIGKISSSVISSKYKVPGLKNGDTVYRVYGGDAKIDGASWTTTDPRSVSNYRNKAGLPSGKESGSINTGNKLIEGTLLDKEQCVLSRKALPLDGDKGGLNEYIIPNAVKNGAIRINSIEGCNF